MNYLRRNKNDYTGTKRNKRLVWKDMDQRTYLENIFKDLCASYNIHEIITPVFEHTELFQQRGVGEQQTLSRKRCIHLKIKDTEAFH